MEEWKEVGRVTIGDKKCRIRTDDSSDGRLLISGRTLIIEELVTDPDITDQLSVKLVRSKHSKGYYCSIEHNGVNIMALGIGNGSKCRMKMGYKLQRATGASLSFSVTKTEG